MLKKAAFVLAAAISGVLLTAAPAVASNAGTTVHMSISLVDAGATVSCGTTVLTATGGTATFVFHESTDTQGIFHVTGTGTFTRATFQDAAGNSYSVSGANWFGGSAYDPDANQPIAFTSTDSVAGVGLELSPDQLLVPVDIGVDGLDDPQLGVEPITKHARQGHLPPPRRDIDDQEYPRSTASLAVVRARHSLRRDVPRRVNHRAIRGALGPAAPGGSPTVHC